MGRPKGSKNKDKLSKADKKRESIIEKLISAPSVPRAELLKIQGLTEEEIKEDTKIQKLKTEEQKAGVPSVVNGNNFEGVQRIDHLPFEQQLNKVFNPLQSITKTDVADAPSEATFIVNPKPD